MHAQLPQRRSPDSHPPEWVPSLGGWISPSALAFITMGVWEISRNDRSARSLCSRYEHSHKTLSKHVHSVNVIKEPLSARDCANRHSLQAWSAGPTEKTGLFNHFNFVHKLCEQYRILPGSPAGESDLVLEGSRQRQKKFYTYISREQDCITQLGQHETKRNATTSREKPPS